MIDDLRPELGYSLLHFHPCTSCGMSKVLRPHDYCNACAVIWQSPQDYTDEYLEVVEDTLEEAAYQSDLGLPYLKAKMEKAAARGAVYVIFYAQDDWQEITINNRYHIPTIMFNLFQALGHK